MPIFRATRADRFSRTNHIARATRINLPTRTNLSAHINLPARALFFTTLTPLVLILALACLTPAHYHRVAATTSTPTTTSSALTVAARVAPILSLAVDQPSVSVDITHTPDGAFNSSSTTLQAATNSADGYSIYIYAADGQPVLRSSSATNSAVINPLPSAANPADFPANTWGYHLAPVASTASDSSIATNSTSDPTSDTATYHPVSSAADTVAYSTSAPSRDDQYTLTFGAKVNTDLPADSYQNRVVISLVANPLTVANLSELTYLQDMSPAVCDASATGDTTQLIDSRDGKTYWVAKLQDGNCWMTQNLDFDLDPAQTLTPADSDVSRPWTPTIATSDSVFANTDSLGTYSYDPGLYLKSTPTDHNQYCNKVTSLADPACSTAGFVEVADRTPAASATADLLTDQTYDAHYLVGNYYQWNAATAGTGAAASTATSTTGHAEATDSICPRGWQLPIADPNESDIDLSFYHLLDQYGLAANTNHGAIASSPLYLQYAGYLYQGAIYQAGYSGHYWSSSTSTDGPVDLSLYFSESVNPTDYALYADGFPVRCLARS